MAKLPDPAAVADDGAPHDIGRPCVWSNEVDQGSLLSGKRGRATTDWRRFRGGHGLHQRKLALARSRSVRRAGDGGFCRDPAPPTTTSTAKRTASWNAMRSTRRPAPRVRPPRAGRRSRRSPAEPPEQLQIEERRRYLAIGTGVAPRAQGIAELKRQRQQAQRIEIEQAHADAGVIKAQVRDLQSLWRTVPPRQAGSDGIGQGRVSP